MSLPFARFLEISAGRVQGVAGNLPERFLPSTDSRTLLPGEAFVCLRGPNFDGHNFIAQAVERGAAAIVVDTESPASAGWSIPVVRVADTKRAYLEGAAAARELFTGQVVAVTGSNGKTTTKEFVAQILGKYRRVLATPHNENNELGVAKLCYRCGVDTEVAIFEFGARHPGEIAQLVDIARPTIGILTNVAEAHLEFFRDQAELARTKFAIFAQGARAVCNAADVWSRMLASEAGMESTAVWVRLIGDPLTTGIMLEAGEPHDEQVALTLGASHAFAGWRLTGVHHLRDALQAAAAAILAGLSFDEAVAQLGTLELPPGRFEMHRTAAGATVVYDAYNASPTSVSNALRAFVEMPAARHIAVLGSMAELGAAAGTRHEEAGAEAARLGVDRLLAGGAFAQALARGAQREGMKASRIQTYANNAEAARLLAATLAPDDVVLLKGSRIEKMEEILALLLGTHVLAS